MGALEAEEEQKAPEEKHHLVRAARGRQFLRGHWQRGSSLSITINVGNLAAGQVCFPATACLTASITACIFH